MKLAYHASVKFRCLVISSIVYQRSVLRHSRDETLDILVDSRHQPLARVRIAFRNTSVRLAVPSGFQLVMPPFVSATRYSSRQILYRTNLDNFIRASTASSGLIHLDSAALTRLSVGLASKRTLALSSINNSGLPKVVQNSSFNHLESPPLLRSVYLIIMLTSFDSATGSTVVACWFTHNRPTSSTNWTGVINTGLMPRLRLLVATTPPS